MKSSIRIAMSYKNILTIVISIVLLVSCAAFKSNATWVEFSESPSRSNFYNAKNILLNQDRTIGTCLTNEEEYQANLLLMDLISEGDRYAFELGVLLVGCLDGGPRGDMGRALSMYFDKNPKSYFKILKKVRPNDYSELIQLSNTPLSLVDQFEAQVQLLKTRFEKIKGIENEIEPELYSNLIYVFGKVIEKRQDDAKYFRDN